MTIIELLNQGAQRLRDHHVDNPRLNAELLLAHSLNLTREALYAHFGDLVREPGKERFEGLLERRLSGEPLQYLLGRQEFWSIDFKVTPDVFIPRPETELLVEASLAILSRSCSRSRPSVLEIGTGCGAIAVALAKEMRELLIVATDISREALLVAKENSESSGVQDRIRLVQGDLFAPFRRTEDHGPFELILSNPPYVPRPQIKNLEREVREYEPRVALDGGEDGMDFHRKIIFEAPFYLRGGGWLLFEVGEGQGRRISEMIKEEGSYDELEQMRDPSGIERVVKARLRVDSSLSER